MKNFKNTLRSLEDHLSRKSYGLHNVNDDAMAASLQEYIEKRRDVEVCMIEVLNLLLRLGNKRNARKQ